MDIAIVGLEYWLKLMLDDAACILS